MTLTPPPVEAFAISKRFGALKALDRVSIKLPSAAFHALLGENGAGKSTLVKCLMGYHAADEGEIIVAERVVSIASPRDAHALGIGMVYQHFTLVPSMTVAENLTLFRAELPFIVKWRTERARIDTFLDSAPFRLDPDQRVADLSAGEKQKLEILKQLFLERRVLILDEPTSVLTPDEADEVLGLLKRLTQSGQLSVLLITHKLREVFAYADSVTVLRRGRLAGSGRVADCDAATLARMMIGDAPAAESATRAQATDAGPVRLAIEDVRVRDDRGREAVRGLTLSVGSNEIVGLAGVSGNGQRELVQALAGQRPLLGGRILLDGMRYDPGLRRHVRPRLAIVPEEPRENACAPALSVAANLALERFDRPPIAGPAGWIRRHRLTAHAIDLIERFGIRCAGPAAPVATLSGGNVQRLVLARTLADAPEALVLSNACGGLDVAAVADVHARIRAARAGGAAVLLMSEDLDELLRVADRIVVMFEGRIVLATDATETARPAIGRAMAGAA